MSLANNPDLWRFKVISRIDSWIEIPGKYEDVQRVGYALYQSIQANEKRGNRHLSSRWKGMMNGSGQYWPYMVLDHIKRLSVRWRPLGPQAKMPDGRSISDELLANLEWMRDRFAIPLIIDAGARRRIPTRLIGDIMVRYLQVVGDVVEIYLSGE